MEIKATLNKPYTFEQLDRLFKYANGEIYTLKEVYNG